MKQAERLLSSALEAGKSGLSLGEYERMVQSERENNVQNVKFAEPSGKGVAKTARYAVNVDNYTEKQYNDYGWARVHDVLTYRENADFKTKYGEIKSGKQREVHKAVNGEIIVAVNDQKQGRFGVDNVLVFAKGSYENYKITKVIRINLNNETSIEIVRGFIYESKGIVRESYFNGILEIYNAEDFQYGTQRNGSRAGSDVVGFVQNGKRATSETGRYSFEIDSEGNTLTAEQAKLTTNKTPTSNPDIRYSLDGEQQQRKTVKVYSDTDIRKAFNGAVEMLEVYINPDEYDITIKSKGKILDKYKALLNKNVTSRTAVTKIANDMAKEITDNLVIERVDAGGTMQKRRII